MEVDGGYRLSSVLSGHEGDVRAVADVNGTQVITASLDTTAKLWDAGADGASVASATFTGHSRYIYSVCYLQPTAQHPDGLFATASVDTMVNLWSPAIHDGPIAQLVGHDLAVCCVNPGPGEEVLSASWDGTARVWDTTGNCKLTLRGHEGSVLAVIAKGENEYITASADKSIRAWRGNCIAATLMGHTDVVRDLALLDGSRLASCSNDGTVRLWDVPSWQPLATITAHGGEYIYSIAAVPTAGHDFVTGGEDGTVAVWKEGAVAQQITMPAQTVWSVAARDNGDIVVGANDGVARVFTAEPTREAPTAVIDHFIEHVQQVLLAREQAGAESGKIGDLDMKDCKGPEALLVPGTKDGQILLVKDGADVTAHSWSQSGNRWDLVGQVSGAKDDGNDGITTSSNLAPPGWRYFDVDLAGGKLVCKHKIGDNPYRTAQNFLDQNELDQNFLDQISEFVHNNTDQAEEAAAKGGAPAAAAAAAPVAPSYFPQPSFVSIGAVKSDGLKRKIAEFNGSVDAELQLDDESITALGAALDQIVSNGPKLAAVSPVLLACDKLLGWPADKRFPGLDVLRLLLTRLEVKAVLFSSADSGTTTLSRATFLPLCMAEAGLAAGTAPTSVPSQMLALRALCNAFDADLGFMQDSVAQLIKALPLVSAGGLKKPALLAFASLILNAVVAVRELQLSKGEPHTEAGMVELGKITLAISDLLTLFDAIFEAVPANADPEVLFRLVVAVGTLVHQNPTASQMVLSMPNLVERIVTKCGASVTDKVAQSAEQLAAMLTAGFA